jgi:TP901 family phage tail tape measure protein
VSEVHRASASLQQLQRELLASNRAISSSTKLANNLFRDTLTGSGQYSSHFVNLNSDVDKFGKNLDAGRLKLRNYFSTFREHATTQKGMIRELAKEQVMLQNSVLQPLGRNAQGLMQYNVMIPRGLDAIANSGKLARMEMQIMNRALSEGAGSLINWGKNTQWAGRQLTVGLTVPLTMFGAAAGKAFREADQELVRLTKVYGGLAATSATELKRVREEVVETAKTLSKTMGASFKDTIALGADIAATGQMGNKLLDSIAETTRLSILGEVDRQDAMKATLSIQTAFKQNTQELTESINFLNAVENQTSTTLADLVEAIPKAGPVIQQLGGDVKDLALYLTAMREGGINASEGANALKSGLASLINPTKQTVGMMSDFGIDVMGMVAKNTGDTTGLLMDLQKALDSLDPLSKARAMEQMFGKFQFARMSALLNNLGKEGSQTLQVLNLMKATTGELADIASRELKMITESASGKYKRAIEGLKAELADVGEEFLGVATKLITAATKILDFFTGLPAPIKKALTFLAGFTALVGPLIMLTGVLANFFGYITKGIVQLRAFFMKANGWKMLTPEIIAAQKAAEMVETAFYSDAAAAQVLHNALQKLVLDYQNLQAVSAKNAVPVNPGVSTVGGAPIMVAGRRVVDPTDPYVGDVDTRAMSHINPRDPNNPATIFGGVPGAMPVNRGISRTPQIYMHDRLPNIEGLTSVKGISTGIVPGEAAKHHALMATLGMQSQQEIAALKKTIAMGGTVSRELLDTFDDILPITQRFADSAATQSAAIVQQMRNAEITVEQAKARIIALNAQIEADMGAAVTAYAAGRGRTIDLTRAPMMDQPVVDANGQFTLRDLYKKKANLSVMNEFGRLRGIRTFGAPYSIQTTRPPRFNTGGEIESFGANKTVVSGPSSVNYDDRLGSVPLGGYVLNQQASMDPANAALVAMAPSTYLNDGGSITAALTPREVVFGPQIQRMPDLYAAVDAANNGYNFGGQIMNGVTGYGKKTANTPGTKMDERLFKKQYKEYLRFINNPRYEDDMRVRMIMLDAAELSYTAKMPMDKAIQTATSNFDSAKMQSGGSDEQFVKLRIKQVQDLEKRHPELKVKNAKNAEISSSKALNYNLNKVRDAMLRDQRFAGVHDLISAVSPTTFKNKKGMPIIQGLHDRAHFRRRGSLGYMTSGYMGLAAVLPSGINNIMSRLETLGLSRDVLNLNAADARENFALALKRTGMDKFATVDDLYAAVMDDGKFKSKAQIESGNVVKANRKQRNSWSMFLEAAATRQKWIPGRPPRLVPAGYNLGGMIPGGSISANRSSYGVPPLSPRLEAFRVAQQARYAKKREADMIKYPWIKEAVAGRDRGSSISPLLKLLAPGKQLDILEQAREMSRATATGSFKDLPPVKYGHMIAPSSGMSYPIPGVSGLYKDSDGRLKFFKGVPNEISAKAEVYGTRMAREVFGLDAPEQTIKTISNPLDPSGKSKLLGVESPFDKRFTTGGTVFTEDEMIRQTIASLVMNNKDLSPSNVYGNVLTDVGAAGVFAKASRNTAHADSLPSMIDQAMINLLGVKGGARKDFAVNTAPLAAGMTAKQYNRKIKAAMKKMHPKLIKFVATLPREDRAPYIKLLQRFENGMDDATDFAPLHAVHVAAKRNSGGPIGGGPVRSSRYAYGRKGNPATRAAQERARAERAASYNTRSGSSYTASGNPQMQVARVPYVGGTGVAGNVYTGVPTASMARTVSTMRLAQFPYMNMPTMPMNIPGVGNTAAISAAFAGMGNSIKRDSIQLAKAIDINARVIAMSTKASAQSMINTTKSMSTKLAASSKALASSIQALPGRAANGINNFRNSVIQEQQAYAARNYPAGMAVPTQGLFGPGYIGKFKDHGDGVQSRKVGSVGFRKREYLVNNASTGGHNVSMTAAQAKAAGVAIPPRGGMGMGAQMGIGMAGSMGGMALMQKEQVLGMSGMQAGMGLMVASSILPFLPFVRMANAAKAGMAAVSKGIRTIATGAATATKAVALLGRLLKGFGPIGLVIGTVIEGLNLYKKIQDSRQDATMGLGLTARAAEQAGIKYFNLNEEMKNTIANRKLLSAQAAGGQNLSAGLPGLAMDVKQMKVAKEEGKKLKELIESINRSSGFDETLRLVSNQKAQFIAAGISVEEANKKIYGALANSSQSGDMYKILSNSSFAGITDQATAANFAVGNLLNTLNKGSDFVDFGRELGAGFESLINIFGLTTKALVGTEDEAGNVIDEFAAYKKVIGDFNRVYGDALNKPIGNQAYNELSRSNRLLGEITTRADSVQGILAKWTLFSSGFAADLSKVDSDLAIKLAGFTQSIVGAIDDLGDVGGTSTTYGTVETALTRLQKTINATSAASQRAANAAQRSAQEELKIIAKKIKLIDDEKNKKLEALRATQEASNYALELQKLQIEYADAISRGDMARANQAKLDIDQLTLNRQSELAQQAVEDAANAAKAPLEKKATGIQEKADARSNAAALAADRTAVAQEIKLTMEGFQSRYNQLTVEGINVALLPVELQAAAQAEVDRKLVALIKEIQKSGTGNSLSAKYIRDGFSKYFTENGKAIQLQTTSVEYNGSVLTEIKTLSKGVLDQFKLDQKAVLAQAEAITGGLKIKELNDNLIKALTRYEPNTPQGTKSDEVLRPGTAKDYTTTAKSLNQAGAAATNLVSGGSYEMYIRENNDGMKEYFKVFKYKGRAYAVNPMDGQIYKYDYASGTITDLYKPVGDANKKAAGGHITGPGTGTSDSIPAMLSHGEYVVKASSVAKYGVATLDAINRQKFHKGGPVNHAHLPDGTIAPSRISLGDNRYVPVLPTGTVWKPGMDQFYTPPTRNYGIDHIKSPMGSAKRFLDIARSQVGKGHNYRIHDKVTPSGEMGDSRLHPTDRRYDLGMSEVNKFSIWGNKEFGIGEDDSWWCGQFVAWVAKHAGVQLSDKMHSAWAATQDYKKKGLFNDLTKKGNIQKLKLGDLAWFDFDYALNPDNEDGPRGRNKVPDHATIVSGLYGNNIRVIGWFGDDVVKEHVVKDRSDLFGSVSPTFTAEDYRPGERDKEIPRATTSINPTTVDTSTATVSNYADGGPVNIGPSARTNLKKKIFESFPKKPNKTRSPGGMGIDRYTPPLVGSGASAWSGGLLGGGGGQMFHDGGLVGHKHPKIAGIKPDGKLSTMLTAAESMLGFKEGNEDNDTFFGKWQDDRDKNINSRFIAWCGAFMNWVANAAGVPLDNMVYTAGGAQKFKEKGDYYTSDPQVGDMAFFNYGYDNNKPGQDRIQHIGLVRNILSKSLLETIEGNTAEVEPPLVFPKGYEDKEYYDKDRLFRIRDGVFKRKRLYNHPGSSIVGFGRPKYKGEDTLGGLLINSGKTPIIPNIGKDPRSLFAAALGYADGGIVNSNNSPFLFNAETHKKNNPLIRENYKLEAEGKFRPYTPAILPDRSSITQEEINQILKGRYLPETPEAAEFFALLSMNGYRDLDFIRKNLKKATAARLPNFNMSPAIGRSAIALARNGRSEEFVRHVLGITDPSIPVPGFKGGAGYANGGLVKGYKDGGLFGGLKNKFSRYFDQFGKNKEDVDKAPGTRKYTEGILRGLINNMPGPGGIPLNKLPGYKSVADFAYTAVGKPIEEIIAGSGTKGDYLWTGLNFVPGSSLLKGAKTLKGAGTIAKASIMETVERTQNTLPLLKSFNPFNYSSIKAAEKGNLPLTEIRDNTVLFPKLLNKLMDGGALALTPAKSAYGRIIKNLNSVAEDFTRGMGGVPDYPWITTSVQEGTGLTIDTPRQLSKAHELSNQLSKNASKGFWALVERSKAYLSPNADNPAFYQHLGAGLHMPDLKLRMNSLGQMVKHPHAEVQTLLHELGHRDHGITGKWKDLGRLLSIYVGDEISPTGIKETYADLFSHRAIQTLRDRVPGYGSLKSRWDEGLAYNLPYGTSSDTIEFSKKMLDNLWNSLRMGMRERGYQVNSAFMETSANMMKIFEPLATGPQSETYLGIGEFLRSHSIINGSDNFEALADMARNLDWEDLIPDVMSATKPNRLTSILSKMPPLGLLPSSISASGIDIDDIMGALGRMLTAPGQNNKPGSMMNLPRFEAGINMVPADMLAMIHKNEAVVPAHMNPFNPNATSSAIASGSVYNISVELNGTNVTAQDVATQIHREMKLKEMAAGVNRRVGP